MQIHILRDSEQFGPYSEEEAREYLVQGSLLPTDMAWHEGIDTWVPLNEVVKQPRSKAPPPHPKKTPPAKVPFQWKRPRIIYPAVGLILLIILYIASPYYSAYMLRNALIKGDQNQLDSSIDFPSVRESLKAQLKSAFAKLVLQGGNNNALAGITSLIVPTIIDNGVDLYITPEGVATLANKSEISSANASDQTLSPKVVASTFLGLSGGQARHEGFVSPFEFVIEANQAQLHLHFVGWGWRLDKIVLTPNFDLQSLLNPPHQTSSVGLGAHGVWKTIATPFNIYTPTSTTSNPDALASVNLGERDLQQQHYIEAIDDYNHAIQLDPNYADAYYHRGLTNLLTSNVDAALADFSKAIKLNPKDGNAYRERSEAKRLKGDLDGALSDINLYFDIGTATDIEYRMRADLKERKGDFYGAMTDINRAIQLNPDGSYYRKRSDIRQLSGDLDGAINDLNQAFKVNTVPLSDTTQIADIKLRKGDLIGARSDYDNLIEEINKEAEGLPNNYLVFLIRGKLESMKGDLDDATTDYKKIIQIANITLNDKQSAAGLLLRGTAKKAIGDFKDAIADYTKGFELLPVQNSNSIQYHAARAEAKLDIGDLDGAIEDSTKAIGARLFDNQNVNAHYIRGMARQQKGDFNGALADYNFAIGMAPVPFPPQFPGPYPLQYVLPLACPGYFPPYSKRGDVKRKIGDLDGAISDYSQAIRLAPQNPTYYCQRGDSRKAKGDLDESISDYSHAITLDSENPTYYYERGAVKKAKGDWGGAMADYIDGLELRPLYIVAGISVVGLGFVLLVFSIRFCKSKA